MPSLKLIESEQPKPKDWRQPYVASWFEKLKAVGRKPKVPYAGLLAQFGNFVLKHWTNTQTGEFEVPSKEDWDTEIDWYLKDEFAAQRVGDKLTWFMQQFGSFEKHTPDKRTIFDPTLTYTCSCGCEHKAPRSRWLKMPHQVACNECKKPFNTSQVINQTPTLKDILK